MSLKGKQITLTTIKIMTVGHMKVKLLCSNVLLLVQFFCFSFSLIWHTVLLQKAKTFQSLNRCISDLHNVL